jgi:ribose transport system substrate-binding protein
MSHTFCREDAFMPLEMSRARYRAVALALSLGAAFALAVSGCSSSGSAGGGSSSPDAGSSTSSDSAGVAAAKSFVAAHSVQPTSLPSTLTALPSKPPTGKFIAVVGQNVTSSAVDIDGIKQAAQALGWKVTVYNSDGTPAGTAQEMNLAVEAHPDAVIQLGFATSTFPAAVAELAKEKIPYIVNSTTDPVGPQIIAAVTTPADYTRRGVWIGNWIVADSDGNANIVVFNLSNYPVLNDVTDGMESTVSADCTACKVAVQQVEPQAIGTTLPAQIVSYLRSHPSVNYIVPTFGDLTIGLPAALASAGLTDKVKVATQSGELTQVAAGQQAMMVPEPDLYLGWLQTDAAVRAIMGVSLNPASYATLPSYYITKSNVPPQSQLFNGYAAIIPNFQAQFKKLWKLS